MLQRFRRIAEAWANWIGDRDLDLALRKHLTTEGYLGDSATITECKLAAVQRPGWVQVYTFKARVRSAINEEMPHAELLGVVRQDERKQASAFEIGVFSDAAGRDAQLAQWSENLISLRRKT